MVPAAIHVRVAGSYSSALAIGPAALTPPVTRTLPSASSVAVGLARATARLAVGNQSGGASAIAGSRAAATSVTSVATAAAARDRGFTPPLMEASRSSRGDANRARLRQPYDPERRIRPCRSRALGAASNAGESPRGHVARPVADADVDPLGQAQLALARPSGERDRRT